MVDRAADRALSLMESKHQQKAAIHMDAVKAELKSGLMKGWKSSLDQNAVCFDWEENAASLIKRCLQHC